MGIEHGGNIYDKQVEIDFSVNVNPLPLPKEVRAALTESLDRLHTYPDMECRALRKAIAEKKWVPPDWIVAGNGASELLMALVHCIRPGKALLPIPSFGGYERALEAVGADVQYYEIRRERGFCLGEDILSCLRDDIDMLFLANPNNPTGRVVEEGLMRKILEECEARDILVVVDECFRELVWTGEGDSPGESGLRREAFPHLVTLHAFTKSFALPGIRLGYLITGCDRLAGEVGRQLPEWNVSLPAQMAGEAAVRVGEGFLRDTRAYLKAAGKKLTQDLRGLGLELWEGEANFLLLYSELPLYEKLLERGILIRSCENFPGLGKGYYRVAVKRKEDNARLVEALGCILEGR